MNGTLTHSTPIVHVKDYCFKRLQTANEVKKAEILLHKVYIEEDGWDFPSNTPSGIKRLETDCGNIRLTDSYSDKAYWFGAFKGGELVGCFRLIEYPNIEMAHYIDLPLWMRDMRPAEMNRLAIAEGHRNQRFLILMLIRICFDFALSRNKAVCAAAEYPRLSQTYKRLGMKEAEIVFKYHENDPLPVEIIYLNSDDHPAHNTKLHKLTHAFIDNNTWKENEPAVA